MGNKKYEGWAVKVERAKDKSGASAYWGRRVIVVPPGRPDTVYRHDHRFDLHDDYRKGVSVQYDKLNALVARIAKAMADGTLNLDSGHWWNHKNRIGYRSCDCDSSTVCEICYPNI